MKKKLLLGLLPILMLASCTNEKGEIVNPFTFFIDNGVPTFRAEGGSDFVTYLMMSKYGRILVDGTPVAGGTVEEKFLENCYKWEFDAGADLPSKEMVASTVEGATFRGWAQYNENVYPDYLTKVPSTSGQCVYAIFDGTNASGGGQGEGGGGGGQGDIPDPTKVKFTVIDMPTWITNDGCVIFAWVWGGNAAEGMWTALTYTSDVTATFEAYGNITGFLLARCANGTVKPDWSIHTDGVGRVYNQSEDIAIQSGVTIYSCSSWKEYK